MINRDDYARDYQKLVYVIGCKFENTYRNYHIDFISEAYVAFAKLLNDYDGTGSFKAQLIVRVRNALITLLKKERHLFKRVFDHDLSLDTCTNIPHDSEYILYLLSRVTDSRTRSILTDIYLHGYDKQETALRHNISPSYLKALHRRGIKSLRSVINGSDQA